MIVKVAQNAGFCKGVQRAIDMALDLSKKHDKVYTLGELVHNENVTSFLASNRVFCLKDDQFGTLEKGDVAVIRAHGLDKDLEANLLKKGVILFDATCPVVKRNQGLIEERSNLKDEIIIIGDKDHDEIKGYLSYVNTKATVIPDFEDIKIGDKPTSIVFQTTILKEKFQDIEKNIKKLSNFDSNLVGIFNTCCYNTTIRQIETRTLAKESDAVIVIGSLHSANTKRLYEVAKEINSETYFVTSVDDLKSIKYSKQRKVVSIVAGASTPPWLIQEVKKLMSDEVKNELVEEQKEATLQNEQMTMEELLKSEKSVKYKVGERMNCKVVLANDEGIVVSIGVKKDGFIKAEDASYGKEYNKADYKKDDNFVAVVIGDDKTFVYLSKKKIDEKIAENEEAEKVVSQDIFEVKITDTNKGGLIAKLGRYTVFIPNSQIKLHGFVKDLEQYKGKTMKVMKMPAKEEVVEEVAEDAENQVVEKKVRKQSKYSISASHKMLLEKEIKEKDDAFWNNISVNEIVQGKVKRFTQFGAFVAVKGADGQSHDCLAHVSELSWSKINDPSKVLEIGKTYDFVVLKLDRESDKVSLGYKQLQKKPYDIAAEKYPVGTVIKGKVHSVQPYGAFILIDDGIDGLVHVSQITNSFVKDANDVLKVGDEVEAKIIGFNENQITLSIKELLPVEEVEKVEVSDEDKAAKRASKAKKFEKAADGEAAPKKERKAKKVEEEATEWVSGDSSSSLSGDALSKLQSLKDQLDKEGKN